MDPACADGTDAVGMARQLPLTWHLFQPFTSPWLLGRKEAAPELSAVAEAL